jgi:hypothetical protein
VVTISIFEFDLALVSARVQRVKLRGFLAIAPLVERWTVE